MTNNYKNMSTGELKISLWTLQDLSIMKDRKDDNYMIKALKAEIESRKG
jgi:hypothetical protein